MNFRGYVAACKVGSMIEEYFVKYFVDSPTMESLEATFVSCQTLEFCI